MIAKNAQELVEQTGTMTAQEQIYQSDHLTITRTEGSFTIADPQGQIQMQFRPSEPGSEIPQVQYKFENMSHELHLELLTTRPGTSRTAQTASQTSIDAGDAIMAANVAMAALNSTEAQHASDGSVFEGNIYRFEQQGNTLTIAALDGRGDISMTNGKLQHYHYSLSPADVEKFERAAAELIGVTQSATLEGATPPKPTLEDLER